MKGKNLAKYIKHGIFIRPKEQFSSENCVNRGLFCHFYVQIRYKPSQTEPFWGDSHLFGIIMALLTMSTSARKLYWMDSVEFINRIAGRISEIPQFEV